MSYDLHQKLRTTSVRQIKRKDYAGAVATLFDGAAALLREREYGSGCDLGIMMLDAYSKGALQSTKENRDRIATLLRLSAPDFWRKKLLDAAIKWSIQVTSMPSGDGLLRLALADVLAEEGSFYAAETHYLHASAQPPGVPDAKQWFDAEAPKRFAAMQLRWLESHAAEAGAQKDAALRADAGRWALRGLLPLLQARALTSSRAFLAAYVSALCAAHPSLLLPTKPNPKPFAPPAGTGPAEQVQLYLTGNSDLNFAQMLLALVAQAVSVKKTGAPVPDALKQQWGQLVAQYEREGGALQEEAFVGEAIDPISTLYFDIRPQRPQGNFMQDMLSSLMGGGGGAGGAAGGAPAPPPVRQPPPPQSRAKQEPAASAEEQLDLD